jgi:hypothetical protein
MKVQGRNQFGFSAALAVLPLAGILFTSLTACSVSDTTAPQTALLNDDDNHVPLKVDPPALDDGGENGGGPTPETEDGSGKGKNPPTSEDTFGEDN